MGSFDVIVIGGGPGGAVTAAALARKGRRVLLLERDRFPRFQIGESLVAGMWDVFDELGLTRRIEAQNYVIKVGSRFLFRQAEVVIRPSEFPDYFPRGYTLHVDRATFDTILLDHARGAGADCREGWQVHDVVFDGSRAVGVRAGPRGGAAETIGCNVVVDASGRSCLLARRLGWRRPDPALNRVSYFTHYEGAHFPRWGGDNHTMLEIHTIRGGWAWYIPLARGVTSVGVVLDTDHVQRMGVKGMQPRYDASVQDAAEICSWLAGARQRMPMQTISNISYLNDSFVGDGFVLVGDAALFLDPIFSAGVFLACRGGLFAARAIDAALSAHDVSAERLRPYEAAIRYPMQKIFRMIYNWYDVLAQPDGDNIFLRSLTMPALRERLVVLWSGGYDRADMDQIVAGMDRWNLAKDDPVGPAASRLERANALRRGLRDRLVVPGD